MKVYVRGYQPKDKEELAPPKRPLDPIEDMYVEYCKEPDWTIALRESAEEELQKMQDMRVHVHSHYCDFSIEELPNGEFAIICLAHPELMSTTSA